MTMRLWIAGGVVVAMAGMAVPVQAQHVAEFAVHDGRMQAVSRHANALDATLAIDLVQAPMKRVLDEVMKQAGVRILYSHAMVPMDRRITVQSKGTTVRAVLRTALAGTGMEAQVTEDGKIAIVRSAAESQRGQGVIVGVVTSAKTGKPLAGATVTLNDASTGVTTGADGAFRLPASIGQQTIHVRGIGFARQAKRVVVAEGETVTVTVILEATTSVLDEVVVTGTVVATERKAIPTPITVITAEDIEKRGITRIEQLFRGEVPGVLVKDEGSIAWGEDLGGLVTSKIYTRGASSTGGSATPLKTYVDGVELLDPAYLGTVDPKSIDRIEIITGPQAATIYGSGAMGGVMQVFTKKGGGRETPDFTLSLKYGVLQNNMSNGRTPSHAHGLSVSGGIGAEFSYSGNLSYNYVGQWQPLLYTRNYGASAGVAHTRGPLTANGSVSTRSGDNGTTQNDMQALGYLARITSGEWQSTVLPGETYSQQVNAFSAQTMSVGIDFRASSIWQHHVTVGKNQTAFTGVPKRPNFGRPSDTLYQAGERSGQRTTMSYNMTVLPPSMGLFRATLTVGANGSNGDQTGVSGCLSSRTATAYVNCRGTSTSGAVAVTKPMDDNSWGGFASARVALWNQLHFTTGLRAERNPNYGRNVQVDWTPTNGLTYTIERGEATLKMMASYGRATRQPPAGARDRNLRNFGTVDRDPASYIDRYANPELRPEYSRGPQGGFELYYGNLGSLAVNRYQQDITDLILLIQVDSFPITYVSSGDISYWPVNQYKNIDKVRQQGWEVTASANLRMFNVRGTYSWTDSRVLSSYWTSLIGSSFTGLSSHTANVSVGYSLGGTSVSFVLNYIGAAIDYGIFALQRDESSYARLKQYINRRIHPGWLYGTRPGYVKSDLSASHRLTPWASATVNVTNMMNNYEADTEYSSPTLGRQTLLGISLRYPKR